MNFKLKRRVAHTRVENIKNRDIYRILKRSEQALNIQSSFVGKFGKEVSGGNLTNNFNIDDIKALYLKARRKELSIAELEEIKALNRNVSGINLRKEISQNVIDEYLKNVYGNYYSKEKEDAKKKLYRLSDNDLKTFFTKTRIGSTRYSSYIPDSDWYKKYQEKHGEDIVNKEIDKFSAEKGYSVSYEESLFEDDEE